jgi:hypothetical protein
MLRRILLASALLLAPLLPAGAQPSLEYQVKAAYISKLAPFIDWPSSAFAGPNGPLVICVVGNDPFGNVLDKAVEGVRDRDHPLQVRRLPAPDPEAACHILFAADAAIAEQAIEQMRAKPVVTVTDSGQPARGMVSFVIAANHVRFDIDAAAAERVGLRFSSKLLSLARSVRRASR